MTWVPQPGPQSSAITAKFVDELFFGGARGGGKSDFLLGDFLQEIDLGPLWRGIIFRKTYNELEELQVRARELFPPLGAVYKTQTSAEFPFSNCWYFPGGATLKMRYLEHERDADGYQGHQYTWVGFDELTNHASHYAYNKLKACVRSAHGVRGRIRSSGNPGGSGHLWVKARFIDVAVPYMPFTDPETGLVRVFIPSKVSDNRYLADNRQYIALIKSSGSAELVKAWLDGDWDIVAGAYFDEWSRARHVIKPVSLPAHWTRYRAFDWGSAKPFACLWIAVSDGTNRQFPRGALIIYREWYGQKEGEPNVGLKLPTDRVADGIFQRDKGETTDEGGWGVADPAIFATNGGESIGETMRKHGVRWRRGDNKRQAGWQQIRLRLAGDDEDGPLLFVFESCIHLIRTLPALQHDSHNPEDVDTDNEDHAPDALRYGCMARPIIREEKKPDGRSKPGTAAHMIEITDEPKTTSKYRAVAPR